jgi:hypothetical protein
MMKTTGAWLAIAGSVALARPHIDTGMDIAEAMNMDWNFAKHQPYGVAGEDPEGWTWKEVPGTMCMDGGVTGYYYRPGNSKKFVTYLMPGGACFNALCDTLATSDPKGSYPPSSLGIYNPDDELNVVKDYTWLFIPYCSGDVFAGNAKGKGGYTDREFRGRTNLDLSMEHFYDFATTEGILDSSLDSFLMTGESAGGFGSVANWDFMRQKFVTDESNQSSDFWTANRHILISDSGIPVDDEGLTPCLQRNWRGRWGVEPNIPEDCTACTNSEGGGLGNIVPFLANKYKNDRIGLLSSNEDMTIAAFFGFGRIKNGLFTQECGNYPALINLKENFKGGLKRKFQEVQNLDNVGTFFFPGEEHTHTTQNSFFDKFFTFNDLDGQRQVYLNEWYRNIVDGTDLPLTVEHGLL